MSGSAPTSYTHPLGVTLVEGGVNVAVYSSVAESVEFCCFDLTGRETRYPLALVDNDIWHSFVPGIAAGQAYGFRVWGPYSPLSGIRCNPLKLLLDPYGRAVTGNLEWRPSWQGAVITNGSDAPDGTDSAPDAPRSVLVDAGFDWGTDSQLRHAPTDSVVYELHVKGFTYLHPAVPDADKGTYAGLAHPEVIAYLQSLGVTAVELLPVHQSLTDGGLAAEGLRNYWGYETLAFFALNSAYSAARRAGGVPGSEVGEFKAMVRALHAAGIEVILDVVFNHTAEGNEHGPTLGFRGIDNAVYYDLVPGQLQSYDNLSGCGNTVNTGSPVVRRLIMDCLRYWVQEMHVDGFRFDLGTVLGRDLPGTTADADPAWDERAAFFDLVLQDPALVGIKLIAEPWDEAGNEQGQFPPRWGEWNGQYRDVMRDYWRAQVSSPRWVGARLAGSPDMYALSAPRFSLRRQPGASVNFITCHDGFTLGDLVSYDAKHNLANDAGNTDGTDDNRSWNCGDGPADDGPSSNEAINSLRRRQQRNFLATLLISRGVPMLLAGDERGRTQQGNNNAYCQDNAISWVDWSESSAADNLTAFVRTLTALRARTPTLRARRFPTSTVQQPDEPVADTGLQWFNPDGSPATDQSWSNPQGHALAAFFPDTPPAPSVLAMFNAYYEPVVFTPPSLRTWQLVLDTNQENGHPDCTGALPTGAAVTIAARSLIIVTG